MDWEVSPFVGIGSICFDMLRTEVRSIAGNGFVPFQKARSEPSSDAYDELGLHFHYDRAGQLECIEVFAPATLWFAGVQLVGRDRAEVVQELNQKGYFGRDVDMGCVFGEQGFSIFAPASTVDGIAVFRRGYFDSDA